MKNSALKIMFAFLLKFNRRNLKKIAIIFISSVCFIFSACAKPKNTAKMPDRQPVNTAALGPAIEEAAQTEIEKTDPAELKKQKQQEAVQNFVENLTNEQLIAQLFVLGIDGKTGLPAYVQNEFAEAAPGSFLLFSSNITNNAKDLCDFTSSIYNWFSQQGIAPLLLIDNEGGAVYRLNQIASPLPSAKNIAQSFKVQKAEDYYALIAKQMRTLGLHVNLAPLVEVQNQANIAFLGSRTFGDAENVENYAAAAVKGFSSQQIGAVLKHFPGNTNIDPHASLPHLDVDSETLQNQYIAPFAALIKYNPAMVLMSHIVVDCVDDKPACFSPRMINDILRGKLGFNGVVISDDLYMGALAKNGYPIEVAAVQAVNAGVNLLMLSEKHFGKAFDVLIEEFENNSDFAQKVKDSVKKIIRLKIELGLMNFDEDQMKITAGEKLNAEEMFSDFSAAKKEALDFLTR